MNRVGRIALGATALAMTTVGMAVPASATTLDRDDTSVRIESARLTNDGDVRVRLAYTCDDGDRDRDRDRRRDDDNARIVVRVNQDGNNGRTAVNVDCDDDEVTVRVTSDDDEFERGDATIRATIRQDGDNDSDRDTVFLRSGGGRR